MKIVYFTKGQRGSTCLSRILENNYQVEAVIGVVHENDIDQLAEKHGFPVLILDMINAEESIALLQEFEADLFILCGYNKIIKQQVIEIPPLGTINLHGGKLPEYRGAAPINWQIINGEDTGGCCIIFVDEGIDTGDIISQELYPIRPDDTHASVLEKTLEIFPRLLLEVLDQIEKGTVQAKKQDPQSGNYYSRRYPQDSKIDWDLMADNQVHNLVRGMHGPYPAAFTYHAGEKVEIDKTRLLNETIHGVPGNISTKKAGNVVVIAKNRGILVEEITVKGKKIVPGDYFVIGENLK